MDTYWSRAARTGQLSPGMSVLENRLSQAGRTSEPGAMQTVVADGAYGRSGARPRSQLENYLQRTAELQKQANDANQARYDEGRSLLGIEDPNEWKKLGFATESAYREDQAFKAQQAAAAAATPVSTFGNTAGPAGVGAAGGAIAAQALASRVQAKQRGIYNSSTALNQEAVTNSLALGGAAMAARNLALQESQVADARRRSDQAAADQLRSQRLEWIYNRNDAQPNLDRLTQIAAKEGEGSTEGMQYPTAQGGGGGGGGGGPMLGGSGYGLPTYGNGDGRGDRVISEEEQQAKTEAERRKEANRRWSYAVNRSRYLAPVYQRIVNPSGPRKPTPLSPPLNFSAPKPTIRDLL